MTKHYLLFYCSGLRSPRWLGGDGFLQKTAEENPFPCLFQLLEIIFFPWFLVPPSIFKVSSQAYLSRFLWFWFSGLPLSSIKMFVSRLGQTGSFNITSPPQHPKLPLQSLFCYRKSHIHRFQGLECEHHYGTIIQPTTPSKMEISVYVQIFKKYFISKIS